MELFRTGVEDIYDFRGNGAYFTAANEQLMDLNAETMPFYSNGVLYVSSRGSGVVAVPGWEGRELWVRRYSSYRRVIRLVAALIKSALWNCCVPSGGIEKMWPHI